MSQSTAGPSRRRRTYAIQSCNSCRRRRCKCDGARPVCGTCTSSGHECSWTTDGTDGRPATKQYVESLRVKILMLESEISQLTELDQEAPTQPQSSDASVPASSPTIHLHDLLNMDASSDTDVPPVDPSVPAPSESTQLTSSLPTIQIFQIPPQPQLPTSRQKPPLTYQYIFNIDTTIPTEQQSLHAQASLACQWNRNLPNLDVQLSRKEHDTILSRFFSYSSSWLSGLIPALFLQDMVGCLSSQAEQPNPTRLQHYSPILHCSLLAIATAFSDQADISSHPTRNKFAAHAKQWLDEALSHPSPSHTLSFILLSEYHWGVGEIIPGFMYMGLSVRATRTPTISLDHTTRYWYEWATFTQEKLMALESKRPSETKVPQVPIVLPTIFQLNDQLCEDDSLASQPLGRDDTRSLVLCFVESCKLMVIATPIINNINKTVQSSEIVHITTQLDAWAAALPDGLCVREDLTPTLPHVLSLHLWFWWINLELYLPLLSEPKEPVVAKCDHAIERLFKLVFTFSAQYGLRYFPRSGLKAIYICGCGLLARAGSAGVTEVDACVSALRTIASTWPCAEALADELEARVASV